MREILRSQFVGTHELRKNLSKLLEALKEEGGEVVITQQGKPTAVIIDLEKYLEVQEALEEFSDPEYLAALLEARKEIREGKGVDAREVFRQKGL
ncbi:MAG: type II toxin-antitoxin system Phd/YefM family antitoxin [Chloroflexi bacterium]|nr:type II toxin-antitoxin system Phd/YefM family antitoxin [Chloroflexota bacterium]